MDEAFDGLDEAMRRLVRSMLHYYAKNKGAALLVSSHNLQELEDIADSVGMLNEGRLVFNGAVSEMKGGRQTCRFVLPDDWEEGRLQEALGAELVEKNPPGYLCILKASRAEAEKKLEAVRAEQIRIRPVRLEEFFRRERKERDVDWEKIFG